MFEQETILSSTKREFIYFKFEEDFVDENVRCIPMLVRFKMDAAGIKLHLKEWSKLPVGVRMELATKKAQTKQEIADYHNFLARSIKTYSGNEPTPLSIELAPAWLVLDEVPWIVQSEASKYDFSITINQWKNLSVIQRYALSKLSRPGHENRNFPAAIKEFNLINN